MLILRHLEITTHPVVYATEWDHYSDNMFSAAGEMLANGLILN
jgi:hypothetical protein